MARALLFVILILLFKNSEGQNPLFHPFEPAGGFSSLNISDIHYDKSGNLWVLTDRSLYRLRGDQQNIYDHQNGLPDLPRSIYEDPKGKIWVYGAEGKIGMVEEGSVRTFAGSGNISRYIKDDLINSFAVDEKGIVWLSTIISGRAFRIEGQKVESVPVLSAAECFIMKRNSHWIWGNNAGQASGKGKLELMVPDKKNTVFALSAGTGSTRSLFLRLENGSFLFAKSHELIVFNDSAIISRSFLERSIESLFEDNEGKLWVGLYNGGVVCYPGGASVLSGGINYLGEKTITSITGDPRGNLWFGTSGDGIFKMKGKPELSYQEPKIFSSSESKPDPIFLPTEESLVTIEPGQNVSVYPVVPVVFLTGIRINGNDTALATEYELGYNEDLIRIQFGGAGSVGEQLRYRYRMWGHDPDWIYTDNTHAQYTKLPPGRYEFNAEAVGNDGTWSKNAATVAFLVNAPFWESNWFRFSLVGGFISLVLTTALFRIRSVKSKERKKSEMEKWAMELEMKALRAQMNPHFIFNTLASIQHYISENDPDKANHFLSRFARLMRIILDHSRKTFVGLQDELKLLDLYLELECLRSGERFSWEVKVDPDLNTADEEIPPMLLQPYVENAIWHGLLPLKRKGKLEINVTRDEHNLIVTISDDGIGRKNAAKSNNSTERKSYGITINSERLSLLSKVEQQDFNIEINDLHPSREETGTKVILTIPISEK